MALKKPDRAALAQECGNRYEYKSKIQGKEEVNAAMLSWLVLMRPCVAERRVEMQNNAPYTDLTRDEYPKQKD